MPFKDNHIMPPCASVTLKAWLNHVGPNSAGQPASEANVGELAERIAAAAAAAVAAAPGQDQLTTMAAFTNAAAHLVTLARSFPDPVSTSRIASAVLPSHGPHSNVKVTLPAIKKWGLKCLFDGRDLDLFLTDCQQFARASNQAPAATIILMVSDELRRVLNLQVSQALSLGKQLTEQEVVASLKELIGYNMHDAKHIAMTRLVHGSIKQRTDQTVLEYAVDFRLEVMRADALPAAVLCDLFVKGLKATIAAQCARTSAGLLWTDLNECITYAIGKEATMPGGSRSGAPVAILSHQDQRKGVDRGHSSFPARGRGRGVQGLMTSDEGHQFKRDGGQWQPVPQGLVPHGGGGRGGPLRGRRGDDQSSHGERTPYGRDRQGRVAIAEEAHEEARAVAARQAQEVVAAMEAPGVVAVKGDGKEARVASRVAAKAVGKEATVAKEAVSRVALSSQHLLLRQCFTSLMSHLPQVHATVSIERSVTPVAAKILPEMLEGIDLILGADWQKSHGAVLDVGSNICHIKVGNKLHKLHSQHHKFRPGAAVLAAVADSGEAVKVLSAKQAARALRKGCCSVLALVQPSAANDDEGWYNGSLASVLLSTAWCMVQFPTVFQDMPAGLPPDRGVGHTIRLEPGHAPPYQRARRYSLKEMDEMRKQVAELLAKKLIEPSSSPYGAPVLFVQKRDGTLRMCIDFRALNKLTVRDRYPLPRIDDLFDRVQGKTVFSSLDLQSGYHQIRITPEDVPKTAFVTPGGQFQYKVLCFGLTNAPATFQRVMNRIFEKQLLAGTILVYLDDILVMSRSPAEHVQHLREVLQVMKDNNLYAKLSKCEFNKPELKFLGHIVGRHGIAVDPAKVQVIQDWAMPTCLKELQAFLGLANFFRRFIAGYSTIAAPLTHLTGEAVAAGTNWRQLSEPAVNAFNALKEALCSAPVLALPDPLQPFEVWSDASLAGTGGVLMQNGRVVAYTSHKFTPAQVKYTTGEQELLGIIRAMQEWRCYLYGAVHVTIVTDHNPLIYLKTQTNLSRRQARWMEFLARFDHHIEYKPGKGNVADPLSRNPGLTHHDDDDDGQPILLTMGAQLCVSGVYAMVMTRRQAGLQVQPPFQPPPVPPSQPAAPRKQKRQQKRVRCASGGPPPPAVVPCDKWPDGGEKQLDSATHTSAGKTHSTTQGSSLVKAIINGYSTDDRFADRAYTQAYELSETGLWMSGGKVVVPKSPLVKREVLEACHDAKYAGHMGMSKTWHTVDLSFTWPGMRKDVEDYVRQCDACQRNKPSTRLKAGKLQPLSIPGRRWESVSMDFIVKLPKSGERGFDSILVFVDRLSKMVHLVPTKESISAFDMATHFFHEVVRLHGMPASVITDRGPHFNSHFWEHVCALCKVAHCMSSAYHPESDGQTERVNRVIEEMLRHYVNDAHTDWAEHLPWVEFAINNSWHESIRQTPFFLNYGQHPLTPATLDLPRKVPKASAFAENVEKEVHKARQCWREAQQRMKALVDGKRREVTYKPEQLVMLSTVNMRKRKDEVGVRKLKPRYVGPFVVLRMIGLVAVQIQLPHRWTRMHNVFHVSLVKPYLGTQAPNMAAPPPVQWLDGEPVYEVEKLLHHKVVKVRGRGNGKGRKPGKNVKQALEFLVRWVGYSEEHDTWEPQKNLVNCDEALQQYIDEHGPLPGDSGSTTSSTSCSTSSSKASSTSCSFSNSKASSTSCSISSSKASSTSCSISSSKASSTSCSISSSKPRRNPPRDRRPPLRIRQPELNAMTVSDSPINDTPTVAEALAGPMADLWIEAMNAELASLHANQTWCLEERPANARVLPTKWVLKVKRDAAGNIEKLKARLVAKGFYQQSGVDVGDVYAPVSKHTTLRTLLAKAAAENMEIHQLDFETAFLNGQLQPGEVIYVQQPEGFEEGSINTVCRLQKALYGLRQAPRAWHARLSEELLSMGFKASEADPALFTLQLSTGMVYLLVYVDDCLLCTQQGDTAGLAYVKKQLSSAFKLKDLGEARWFLGMQLTRDRAEGTIKLDQHKFVQELVTAYSKSAAHSKPLPMAPAVKLVREGEALDTTLHHYSALVGSLLYLTCCTRPDIAFAVGALARHMSAPTKQHWSAACSVLCYLKGTADQGLLFGGVSGLQGYSDADYAGDKDTARSTTGYLFTLNGGAISWSSRLQPTVAMSTAEAEYMAASSAAKEALWLRKLMRDLQLDASCVHLGCDNQAAIQLLHNPMATSRAKHIDVHHHFVRERISRGEVAFHYCHTSSMLADILTKPLAAVQFNMGKQGCGVFS
ncbi:hypothetical protein QJQ45_020321 [Haematococcus lacustris]|nr:hypothetical protein QJQ45_020321 [Haematococcus lacustris]